MKRTVTGIALLVVSLSLTFLLAGCGAKNQQSTTAPIKITYWHRMTGSYNQALNHLITKFNRSQSRYKVVGVSQGSYDALQQKIVAAAKSKTLPVMAQTPYTNIGDYVKDGLIVPFDTYMTKGTTKLSAAQRADIYPSFLKTGYYQGHYYGLPFSVSDTLLFYNRKLMKQYHVTLPKTWSELQSTAKNWSHPSIALLALDQSYDVPLESMAHQAQHPLITAKRQANLAAPTTLQAVETLLGLRQTKALHTAGNDWYFTVAFLNQRAIFGLGSSASIPEVLAQAGSNLEWGTTEIPAFLGNNESVLNGNDNVLFKGSTKAQQRGAWAFQKFLLKAQNTAYWAQKTGYVPVTKAGTRYPSYQAYLKKTPVYQAAITAAHHSFASTVFAGYSTYRNNLLNAVDATLTKKVSGKAAFTALQQQTQQLLK